ncbi:ABC transporter substrate-binding protein [Cupriavidus gilardii]|uniref:ABC transporter substrate-binding protein n=1 Tax=Cupriavidus gilardii TaxID=82541 RepID=UPI001EE57F04|nr:ABC transporter substrate-binding protein [Cupriavidus gilardii]MCG5259532.1 ABC transporter substrate-binding protein [Cupriavidus gilardii]
MRVIGPWELSSLDPLRGGYLFARMQVAETLVDYDAQARPVAALASRWQVSTDGLEWRFVLREGARFHDGSPVRARDVVNALRRALHPAGVLGQAPIAAIDAVTNAVTDAVTDAAIDAAADVKSGAVVRIRLRRPFPALPALLSHSSTQILAPASFGADGAVRAIVGSGPYRVVTLEPPQRFSVVAFDGWRGPAPAVRRASYLAVGRAEMRALMAEAGQAELAYGLDPGSVARLRRGAAVRVHQQPIPRTTALKLNAGHPVLADLRARQALSLALDRRGIAQAVLREPSLAATQLFPPALAGWHRGDLPPLAHDPVRARALLAELGWRPGTDGVLVRDGKRFALTLQTFPDRPELPVIAAAIQEQLRLVGVRIRVAVGNSSEIPLGHRDGTLEMGLIARNYGAVPDAFGTIAQDFGAAGGKDSTGGEGGAAGGDWGAMGWSSPTLTRALTAMSSSADAARAQALREQIAGALHDGLPLVPVLWYQQTLAASPQLAGVSIDPFERSYRLTDLQWTR